MADTDKVILNVQERLVELSVKLESLAVENAPEAWNTALTVVQISYAQRLVLSFCGLALGSILAYACWRFVKKVSLWDHDTVGYEIGAFISGMVGGLMLIGSLINVFTIWNWVGIFRPELVIAKRILDSIL